MRTAVLWTVVATMAVIGFTQTAAWLRVFEKEGWAPAEAWGELSDRMWRLVPIHLLLMFLGFYLACRP